MVSQNKKRRKNNRNNKKNKIKKEKLQLQKHEQQHIQDNKAPESEEEHGDKLENEDGTSTKRHIDENDSDTEEQPRKKKKKHPVPADSSEKKGKKSIRQMKREKHAERQAEAATVAKDQLKSQCLYYLSQWKHNKQNWKFMKAKQVWLYKNKFSSQLLPDASWPLLLEYFESAQGNIRNMLLEDANKVMKLMDDWTEKQNIDNNKEEKEDSTSEVNKPDETTYKRARDLIQCLHE